LGAEKPKNAFLNILCSSDAIIFGMNIHPLNLAVIAVYLLAMAGMGFSAQWVCPHSMIPDVIEYDELKTGERREGVYYGMQATATKVTAALASLITNWVLSFAKYDANLGLQNQPESAQFAIRVLFALIPAIFLLICVPLLIKYPITKESHAEVVKQLEERRKLLSKEENK
jgi:GPH family glycoside/pentoside/hexuronide:cation symporter